MPYMEQSSLNLAVAARACHDGLAQIILGIPLDPAVTAIALLLYILILDTRAKYLSSLSLMQHGTYIIEFLHRVLITELFRIPILITVLTGHQYFILNHY